MKTVQLFAALIFCGAIWACDRDQAAGNIPPPIEPTVEAMGHYCGMNLREHAGPKGQIHLKAGLPAIWFTSVRDTLAFTMLPDEAKTIAAIYVNDMGRADNWDQPEPGAWVEAREAHYVIGSSKRGGMGAPEAVPFSEPGKAAAFRQEYGGVIVTFDQMPPDYILGETWQVTAEDGHENH